MYLNTILHGSHLVVQFGQTWHQLTYREDWSSPLWSIQYRPYYPSTRIRPTSLIIVSAKSFPDRSRPLSLQPTQMGSRFIRPLCVWPAANHASYGQHVSIHEVQRRTAITTWSRWWCNPLAGVYRGYSTRRMIKVTVEILKKVRLRWFGHVICEGDTDWIKCTTMEIDGIGLDRGSRPPKKTWWNGVRDMDCPERIHRTGTHGQGRSRVTG